MPNVSYKILNKNNFELFLKYLKKENIIIKNTDLKNYLKLNDSNIMLVVNANKVVGFIEYKKFYNIKNNPYYKIETLYLQKEYRKMGIGISLIKRLELNSKQNNIYYLEYNGFENKNINNFLNFNHFKRNKLNKLYKKIK